MATLADLWQQYQQGPGAQKEYINMAGYDEGIQQGHDWRLNPDYLSQSDFLFGQGYVSPDYLTGKNIGPIGADQYLSQYLAPGSQAIQDPNFGTVYQRPTWEQASQMGLPITDLMRFGQQQGTAGSYYNPALMGSDQATALGLSYGPANEGGGGIRGFLNQNVDWMVPAALAGMGGYAAGGAAGLYGVEAGAGVAGAEGGAATAGGAGTGAVANQQALYQMAFDAGLEGAAADAFVASGGAMGSTAAGGGGLAGGTGAGGPPPTTPPRGSAQAAEAWRAGSMPNTPGTAAAGTPAAGTALSRIIGNDPNN